MSWGSKDKSFLWVRRINKSLETTCCNASKKKKKLVFFLILVIFENAEIDKDSRVTLPELNNYK